MNQPTSKVYIVTGSPGKDLVPALKFGEPVLLLQPWEYQSIPQMVDMLYDKLQAFNPDQDYLVMTGEVLALCSATAIIAEYVAGPFQVLRWSKRDHAYEPCEIDFTKGASND